VVKFVVMTLLFNNLLQSHFNRTSENWKGCRKEYSGKWPSFFAESC